MFTETIARSAGHSDKTAASQDQKQQASENKKSGSSQPKTADITAAPVVMPQTIVAIALPQPAWTLPVSAAVPVHTDSNNSTVAALVILTGVSSQTASNVTASGTATSVPSNLAGVPVAAFSTPIDGSAQENTTGEVNPVVAGTAYGDNAATDAADAQANATSIKAAVNNVELANATFNQPLTVQQASSNVAAPVSTAVDANVVRLNVASDDTVPIQAGSTAVKATVSPIGTKTAVSDTLSSLKASLGRDIELPASSTSVPASTSTSNTVAAKSQVLSLPKSTVDVAVAYQAVQTANAVSQSPSVTNVVRPLGHVGPVVSSDSSIVKQATPVAVTANATASSAEPVPSTTPAQVTLVQTTAQAASTQAASTQTVNSAATAQAVAAQTAMATPAAAMQASINVPVLAASVVPGNAVQTASTSFPFATQFSNSIGRDGVTNQSASSAKTKVASSDSKTTKNVAGQDDQSSDSSTNSSFVVKAADSVATQNQGAHDAKAPIEASALQQAVQAAPTAAATKDQSLTQSAVAATVDQSAHRAANTSVATDAPVMPGVSSAQLVQSASHSEMRLGIQSAEFGNISISTSLNHQALSAQISIEHSELGRALAVHLPAIEEKLGGAYGVQARVEVRDGGNANNASTYSNSGQQQREGRSSQGGNSTLTQGSVSTLVNASTSSIAASVPVSSSRLDVRI